MKNVYVYKGFERFWHWSQTTIISALLFTGIEVHGSFTLLGFENSVLVHNILAWLLVFLVVFAMFWHFTTGEWKQYIPTTKKLFAVGRYYGFGIFRGEHHPADKSLDSKLNPLQRLSYLALKLFIIPVQLITGLMYYYYNDWALVGDKIGFDFTPYMTLEYVGIAHTLCAYALSMFIVVHVYLTTTGHTVFGHIQSMVTGWEELPDEEDSKH